MKNRFLCLLLVCCLLSSQAQAGAAGAALSAEIGAVLNTKAIARGFAANDPRYAATLAAVGGAAEAIGVGVVAAGTAPAWGAILASAAVAGAVGYGLQALSNWLFNGNGTVTVGPSNAPPTFPGGSVAGQGGYCNAGYCSTDPASSWVAYMAQYNTPVYDGYPFPAPSCSGTPGQTATCSMPGWYSNSNYHPASQHYWNPPYTFTIPWTSNINTSCPSGQVSGPSGCAAPVWPAPPSSGPTTSSVGDALNGMTDAQKATPLAPADVAAIADAAWKNAAAQPGYGGLPYLNSDPVTAADVSAARAANPGMAPSTVGDLAAPIPQSNAVTQPSTQPSVNPGTNPSTQPQINLGNDPGIGAPSLEATPTATQILSPLLNLMPDLRSFVVPSHQSVCPTSSMTLWNRTLTLDSHCAMLENLRPTLYAVMAFVWIVLAMFIFLAA